MTQKDNVKQLIGKSLNAYNNKVLQQIDRIEKKNKQQNHKISMLTNELDNDYLTKSEEGSVISLEHSKEGMVYIDSLEGNTLVNYCTDGSKELTLNGDIDLEGTFVTTTEGVDNGLVDVYCEGNTLVGEFLRIPTPNLQGNEFDDFTIVDKNDYWECRGIANKDNITMSVNAWSCELGLKALKEGVEYTVIVYDCPVNSMMKNYLIRDNNIGENFNTVIGTNKWKIIAKSDGLIYGFYSYSNNVNLGEECIINFPKKVLLLEGDWTNKEIPPYFIGMKSVGQDDENGHKIEILSRNKNMIQGLPRTVIQDVVSHDIYLEPNKTYSISTNIPFHGGLGMIGKKHNHANPIITFQNWGENVKRFSTPNNFTKGIYSLIFWKSGLSTDETSWTQVEIGTTTTEYTLGAINKKEILLNEPLRKVNDDLKDRFVKIGNKCFIERNCKVQTLNGSEGWRISDGGTQFICNQHRTDALGATNIPIICDKINVTTHQILDNGEGYGINLSYYLRINLRDCDAKNGATVEQFIQRLQANPVTIIYPLKTPTYEPLEINPELITYLDTTHISNNSIIPCNMKVQNSGYNTIIKPSTLYTVALDTNKSGTIGMNLGGVKGTTKNNVLTLTTPATLTDDSLRLYGKGIKGSKVRLLEGDKTNWIPSHFEGMKSCFEDKVQEDGSYKMEILSNNKNLFNENILEKVNSNYYEIINKDNRRCLKIERPSLMFRTRILNQLKKNTSYKINFDMLYDRTKGDGLAQGVSIHIVYTDGTTSTCYASNSYNEWLNANITTPLNKTISYIQFSYGTNTPTYIDLDTFIIQENNNLVDYVYHKSNKIQFSSIEPLRGVGDVKDRFVFKDGKLMIERNCDEFIVDGVNITSSTMNGRDGTTTKYGQISAPNRGKIVSNALPNRSSWVSDIEGIETNGDAIGVRIHKSKLDLSLSNPINDYLKRNNLKICRTLITPTYEEIPFELQKIILEGYENGTLFFDTNIPPTSTVAYAGETPIVKSVKLNKTEVLNNTTDINDNIIPYLMDMDYRVVCLELATETQGISMARLFGGTYEMLKRDILSKRYSVEEYKYRLDAYLSVNKITEKEYEELGEMLNE